MSMILSDTQSIALEGILPKLLSLQTALENQDPGIANRLKDIKQNLSQFPDLVHFLTDEQIQPIYSAMMKESKIFIEAKAAKKRTGGKASAADTQLLMEML